MKRVVLLLESSREFGRQLIIGITRYARINGPWTFFKRPIDLKSSIPHLTAWKPDGLIMRDSFKTRELLKLNIPSILVVNDSSYPKGLPSIRTDSKSIGRMASTHFIERGFKNLAFCGFDKYDWSEERKLYFNICNTEAGFKTNNYIQLRDGRMYNWNFEQQHVLRWVKSLPKPVGIFACNDDRGQNILEVCKLLDLKVPAEVAVIGVDNDPMICELEDPPLTSIALNVEPAGFEAAKLLDQLMNNKKLTAEQKTVIVVPSHVVQRQSSDILAVGDPEVAAAMSFIKQNAKGKILVKDVVKETSVSRRTLENRFKNSFHRSINTEIRQVRVEWISKMLIESDLPISRITSLFEFTDSEHISRYFKKEKGLSLREFRKLHKMA